MTLLFLNEMLESDWAEALAWTLLHSTWQGTLAAVVAGLIILFTRKKSATVRYYLFTTIFILFIGTVLTTFVIQLNSRLIAANVNQATIQQTSQLVIEPGISKATSIPGLQRVEGLIRQGNFLLHRYYPILFGVWLVIFLAKLFCMVTGFRLMSNLRKSALHPADIHWQNLVDRLSDSMGITRQVLLLESAKAKVPMMLGYFKPVILVPLGLFCQLPAIEMEAILLHELAHIRRSDYLMNLLQRFTETVFFFHPCIWWLSSLMREERENCCDDIAVLAIKNKEQYIHALVSFQEYNLAYNNAHAIAFAGSRYRLLHRVKRLLINENKKLNHMEKMILVCSMFVLTAAFTVTTKGLQAQERNRPSRESQRRESAESELSRSKTILEREDAIDNKRFNHVSTNSNESNGRRTTTITATDEQGKKYVLRKIDGRVSRLSIDKKEIDENDLPEYESLIKQIEESSGSSQKPRVAMERRNSEWEDASARRGEEAAMLAKQRQQMAIELERRHAELERMQHENYNNEENRQELNRNRNADKIRLQRERMQQENNNNAEQQHELIRGSENKIRLQRERAMQDHERISQQRKEESMRDKIQFEEIDRKLREQAISEKVQMEQLDRKLRNLAEREQAKMEQLDRKMRDQAIIEEKQSGLLERKLREENRIHHENRNRNENNIKNQENILREEMLNAQQERQQEQRMLQAEKKEVLRQKLLEQQQNRSNSQRRTIERKSRSNDEIVDMLEFLEEEGVIDSRDQVSFRLNEEELIVNGKRQPASLHEELKEKYIRNPGDAFIYEKHGNTTRTTINRN